MTSVKSREIASIRTHADGGIERHGDDDINVLLAGEMAMDCEGTEEVEALEPIRPIRAMADGRGDDERGSSTVEKVGASVHGNSAHARGDAEVARVVGLVYVVHHGQFGSTAKSALPLPVVSRRKIPVPKRLMYTAMKYYPCKV